MARPDWEPEVRIITAITNAQNAEITTAVNHGFEDGSYVRLIVPVTYGMNFDYVETKINVTALNKFTCNIDTFTTDQFIIPSLTKFTPAHCCPSSQIIDNVAI